MLFENIMNWHKNGIAALISTYQGQCETNFKVHKLKIKSIQNFVLNEMNIKTSLIGTQLEQMAVSSFRPAGTETNEIGSCWFFTSFERQNFLKRKQKQTMISLYNF